jgi:hypothetical protein
MYGAMTDDPYRPPKSPGQKPKWSYAFYDMRGTVTSLRVLLWLGIVVTLVAAASDFMQLQLMSDVMAGRLITASEADANDARQGMIGVAQVALYLVTVVVFLRWLYHTNSNAHTLASGSMRFTPGWAVGWYFVPILNFWMPFQVMKEIWQVSQEGAKYHRPNGQVIVWWTFFLSAAILSRVAARMLTMAGNAPAESFASKAHAATLVLLLADLVHLASCIVTVALVNSIQRLQAENLERHKASAATDLA